MNRSIQSSTTVSFVENWDNCDIQVYGDFEIVLRRLKKSGFKHRVHAENKLRETHVTKSARKRAKALKSEKRRRRNVARHRKKNGI